MDYPLITEYVEAIKAAEDNLDQLKNLRPVLDEFGLPVMTSGNFAVVFKMKDEQTGKFHALKCFLKEQEGRAEAYCLISEELSHVNSDFLTPIKYLENELFVDSKNSSDTEFPVILMDWVEGMTLDKYIHKYVYRYLRAESLDEVSESQEKAIELLGNGYELDYVAYQFSRMAMWLAAQPFAHGDLKPDNILVREDGTLVLVDYDGMYVQAMKGQKAREIGSPDFRHPQRTIDDFDEHIDDFPLSSMLLSILAISNDPSLMQQYGGDGRLLFSERDYCNLAESQVIDALKPQLDNSQILTYLSLFYLCAAHRYISKESFSLYGLPEPEKPFFMVDDLSTTVSDDELKDCWEDEYHVKYSRNFKKLLKAPEGLVNYQVRESTRVICDKAFSYCIALKEVSIPDTVKSIGECAFEGCKVMQNVTLPKHVTNVPDRVFCNCYALKEVSISNDTIEIGTESFQNCAALEFINIPQSLVKIGDSAFFGCESLKSITIPKSVVEIGVNPFAGSGITKITCQSEHFETDEDALYKKGKTHLIALLSNIKDYEVPLTVSSIGEHAFYYCSSLRSLRLSDSVNKVGQDIFWGCIMWESVIIPKGTLDKFKRLIPNYAFKLNEV